MTRDRSKPKLLCDENFRPRTRFPKLNRLFDVEHVGDDLKMSGLKDPEVYELAKKLGRIVVTHNDQDFRPYADKSLQSGVIGVSQNLRPAQIDTKLVALLRKTSHKNLYGAFHYISGESRS